MGACVQVSEPESAPNIGTYLYVIVALVVVGVAVADSFAIPAAVAVPNIDKSVLPTVDPANAKLTPVLVVGQAVLSVISAQPKTNRSGIKQISFFMTSPLL